MRIAIIWGTYEVPIYGELLASQSCRAIKQTGGFMRFKLKVLSIVSCLFAGSFASAYESNVLCPNMIQARASAAAAQELVEKDSRTYFRLEGILTVIKNGLIYNRCSLENVNNVAGSVRIPVRTALFKCPQQVVVIGFVDQTIASLNIAIYGVFGGYRSGAIERATLLSADLKAALTANQACQQ